jgi:hypothetical protein
MDFNRKTCDNKHKETSEKLHKARRLVIPAKAGIKYVFMVPRFHGDDAWIPAGACPRMTLSGTGMTKEGGNDRSGSFSKVS